MQKLNKWWKKYASILSIITLVCSLVFYVLGIVFPIISTKNQIFGIVLKYRETTIIDSVRIFFDSGDFLIAIVIFLFTICLPLLVYLKLMNDRFSFFKIKNRALAKNLDKWSMIDVFLVALLLLNFKMNSKIIVMQLEIGTSFIAASVILRITASWMIEKYKELDK